MAGLKFRVVLDTDDKKEIFRDILLDSSSTFENFYQTIISAFSFQGNQMASFYISNDDWDKGEEITLMDMSFGNEASTSVMSNSLIAEFIEEPDQKIILVYDFLRMWIFLIELVAYESETPEEAKVLLSVGDAPDEESKSTEDSEGLFEGEKMNPLEDEDFDFDQYKDELGGDLNIDDFEI